MRTILFVRVMVSALLLCPAMSTAQFSVSSFAIAGGGGASDDGTWRVTGTIGQVDADLAPLCSGDGDTPGLCAGASYKLTGGFWWAAGERARLPCDADLRCVFRDGFELG